jgi:phage terminase Nu1 subunit (DNA packaging protein)
MVRHVDLDGVAVQEAFGLLVGVSQQKVSQLAAEGILPIGGSVGDWLQAYCYRLREQAAGRLGSEIDGLDLVQERAALAREQRMTYEIRNAVARGEYAPIAVLADVLATASQAVVERFEQLSGQLKKTCPDLPDDARQQVELVLASARNEWVRSTAELVARRIAETTDDAADDASDPVDA